MTAGSRGGPTLAARRFGWVDVADEASQRALELLPGVAALQGTRALALHATGRLRAAIELATAAVLAMACAGDRRFAEAERWLAEAQRLDPSCDLLERARRELSLRRPSGPEVSARSRRIDAERTGGDHGAAGAGAEAHPA